MPNRAKASRTRAATAVRGVVKAMKVRAKASRTNKAGKSKAVAVTNDRAPNRAKPRVRASKKALPSANSSCVMN